MAEYIKRDSVINLIKLMEYSNGVIECYADEFISDINAIPSADVTEVKHGRWLWELADNGWADHICSKCGYTINTDVHVIVDYNYCANCGAIMDGG